MQGSAWKKNLLWSSAAMLLSGSLLAQSNQGTLSGTVVDASGAAIPNAGVKAKSDTNGQTAETLTTGSGNYRFPSLGVGTYTLTVTQAGFKSAERTSVAVQIQTTTTLDFTLDIGQQSDTVTVSADALQLQTESADVGTVVTSKQVIDLPLSTNGNAIRNSQSFVFLTPATYGTGTSGGTFEAGVSGGQAFGSEILFDGASLQVPSFGDGFADEILPSVEATGEFKVLIAGIPAQFGRTSGGIQSYASRAGTNDYHGGAFEIYRNTNFDANLWFNNLDRSRNGPTAGNATPADNKNNYGVLLGGPVRIPHLYNGKDKTFFFFSWEQFRTTQGFSNELTLPTQANLAGDFSANLGGPVLNANNTPVINPCDGSVILQGQVFDPRTTRTVNGQQCRTAFAGNRITAPISPVARAISAYIPQTTTPGNNNYIFSGSYPIISTAQSMRFDHSFSEKDRLFVAYHVRDNVRNNNLLPGTLQLPISRFITSQDLPTHLVRVSYDHVFSPRVLNHTLVATTRVLNKEGFITPSFGMNFSNLVGLPGGDGPFFPGIIFNEAATSAVGNPVDPNNDGFNSNISDQSLYLSDSLAVTKGRHNMQFGGDWRYTVSISNFLSLQNGTFNFSRAQTAATLETSASSGNGVASFLLGQVQNATVKRNFITSRNIAQYSSIYFQDEFKYSKELNFSLGLRYDVDVPFKENHDFGSQFDPNQINTGATGTGTRGALTFAGSGAGKDGVSSRWVDVYYKNIEPRIGLTYSPAFLNHQTVISATYNLLNSPILQWQQIYGGLPAGYSNIQQVNNTLGNTFAPAELLDQGSTRPPQVVNPGSFGVPPFAAAPSFDRSQRNGQVVNYSERDFGKPGFNQTWSLNVQQQLAQYTVLTLGYLGERGTRLGSNLIYLNDINPSSFQFGSRLNASYSTVGAAAGVRSPYPGFTGTLAQALRPFPQYSRVNTAAYGENRGQLSYHALTAKLERRLSKGVSLLASYTWSKSLTDTGNIIGGSLGGAYTASIQNPFNLRAEKTVSPQDVPHIFVVSYLYDLPFGKGRQFLNSGGFVDRLVGGWSITGIQRYQSGQPLGFGCATGIPGFDNCIRFNLVPGQNIRSAAKSSGSFRPGVSGQDRWYNRAAFSDPNANVGPTGAYAFGNKPQYQSDDRSNYFLQEDFALIKRTHIKERLVFQFRAEAFNAFNRHVFGNPNGNFFDQQGFGTVNYQANSPRSLQLTFRAEF